VLIGTGGGGGLNGWYLPDRTGWELFVGFAAGELSRLWTSACRYDSAVIAARNSSVSAFH
jgi:hypothetical protein